MPPIRSHLSNFAPPRGLVHFDDPDLDTAFRQVGDQIANLASRVAAVSGPGLRPTGPTDVTATVRHKAIIVYFRPDRADVSVRAYRVWRAHAGTTAVPVVPSATAGVQIGTVAPTWTARSPFEVFSFLDMDFTDAEMTAPEEMFMYWVSTLDIKGVESSRVPIIGGPVACLA